MKRTVLFALSICILAGLAGCGKTPLNAETTTPTQATKPSQTDTVPEATDVPVSMRQKPVNAVSVPLRTTTSTADDGTVIFAHSYQDMTLVLQEPEVADKVIVDFLNRVDSASKTAEELLYAARSAYSNTSGWIPYMCRVLYEPTRIDQSVLSLFGSLSSYAGGIHPDHINVSANYDLMTGDVLTLGSIMHKDATMQMFCDLVIQELNEEKEHLYLFSDFETAVQKRFAVDESQDEHFYFSTTGLCFYFSPYEIAPYSSGTIVAEIPYEKLTGLLHDAYFPAESVLSDGVISGKPYEQADMDRVFQISEAILTPGGEMLLLTADEPLESIFVHFISEDPQVQDYVFFGASTLSPGDGIMVQAAAEEMDQIFVEYENISGKQTHNFSN